MPKVDMQLVEHLEEKAIDIRKKLCLMTHKIGNAHLGGALSMTDMAVALYYHFLKYDPKNPKWPDRDRFILSKGHTACLLYNIYADLGMYPWDFLYNGYNKIGGKFGQHPNRKYLEGIEASTGSLGHGLSIAVGFALAGRANKENWRVVCMLGDGELDEGSNWEAIMAAAHYRLGNLVAIVDRNGLSIAGNTEDVMALEPLDEKWRAFGWDVITINGNDMEQVVSALSSLPPADSVTPRKPMCIISKTTKGCGIPFMENMPKWHIGGLDDEKVEECCQLIEKTRKVRG